MSITLDLTADQRQILAAVETLLAGEYPVARLHRAARDDLRALADFGAFALSLPDAAGGAGLSLVEEALVHARLGRHLLTPGTIAAAVGARLAWDARESALSQTIASGTARVAAGVMQGDSLLILDAPGADWVLWPEGDTLRRGVVTGGVAERSAGVTFAVTRAPRPRGEPGGAAQWTVLVCAHLLGVAEGARDLAVAYAGLRTQFGRPIGAFQAIKHHAADMALGAEMLSAQLDFAALTVASGRDDAEFQVASLARIAPGIALRNARLAIQIHGGIGFSAEADAHLFLKHAHRLALLLPRVDLLALPAPLAPFERTE